MLLSKEVIQNYAKSRNNTDKSIVCHAPFVSLNFEQNGNVRACCYNTQHILGKWPDNKIKEVWEGSQSEILRKYIKNNELGGGCSECGMMIESGNHAGVRARFYDEYASPPIFNPLKLIKQKLSGKLPYPKVMEFELSNKCNLECVMCNGYFSSSIRKNREKLPPLTSPYNDDFVDELEEFIPHLTDAKFLGGEPFMIDIYLKIWERIRALNPNMQIHITTNGTFLTDRVKKLLEGLRAGIIISTDSVNKETYNKIRINGKFDKVMQNIEYFRDYAKRKKTFISMAVCPITHNWHELPEILDFCIKKNISLYLNAVYTPEEFSLKEQPLLLQEKIIAFLKDNPAPPITGNPRSPGNLSIKAYNDFLKMLEAWVVERRKLLSEKYEKLIKAQYQEIDVDSQEVNEYSEEVVLETLMELIKLEKTGSFLKIRNLHNKLYLMFLACPPDRLDMAMYQYIRAHEKFENKMLGNEMKEKSATVAKVLNQLDEENKANVLKHVACTYPLKIANTYISNSVEQLIQLLNQQKA